MTRESAATKATRYLAEGRLAVLRVHRGRVASTCRGEGHIWLQSYRQGEWRCTCPARTDRCAHLQALRRVVVIDLKEQP